MRILKRNLAFVLVMAMAIGMMVSANAANVEDYRDANDIKFTEAVDVLTALGVLEGENGTFHPERVLTREEGAKIITYLMLGDDAADSLNTSVAPFADVAAGRWSAGYIAYCVSQGIVGGYGNGNFGPTDTLTGTQFAKMLLVALGYGVNGEFTGANWEIETNKQALLAGVYEGNLGVNFSAGVKREEAAQYAFNTLANIPTVSYSDVFGAYYSGKLLGDDKTPESELTLGYKLYNLTKVGGQPDDFGRDCHSWKRNSKNLTELYNDAADAVYTSSVKSSKIYADLGLTKTVAPTIILDGTPIDNTAENAGANQFKLAKNGTVGDVKTGDLEQSANILVAKDTGAKFIGNGVIVEAFEDDDDVTLIVTTVRMGKVTAYDAKKGEVTVAGKKFETAVEYEKDDIVLYTMAAGKLQSVKPAKTVEGKLTGFSASYVTFDGDKYDKALNCLPSNTANFTDTFALVLDDNGYAMGLELVEETEDDSTGYLYVYEVKGSTDTFDGDVAKADVKFLNGEGREIVNLLTRKKDGDLQFKMTHMVDTDDDKIADTVKTEWLDVTSDLTNAKVTGFYAYTMEEDKVVLKDIDCVRNVTVDEDEATATVDFDGKKTSYTFGTLSFDVNARTVAHVVDKDNKVATYTGTKNLKFTVKKGTENIPMMVVYVDDKVGTTLAKEIFIVGNAETTSEAVFAWRYDNKVELPDNKTGVYLDVIGGENQLYTVNAGSFATKGVYSISLNSKGEVTEETIDSTKYDVTGAVDSEKTVSRTNDNYFTDEEGNHNFAENCKVYKVDSDGLTETTLAEGNKVVYVTNVKDSVNEVIYVFVVKES